MTVCCRRRRPEGTVIWFREKSVIDHIWAALSQATPDADQLIVTLRTDGTVNLIPAKDGQVCGRGFATNRTKLDAILAAVK